MKSDIEYSYKQLLFLRDHQFALYGAASDNQGKSGLVKAFVSDDLKTMDVEFVQQPFPAEAFIPLRPLLLSGNEASMEGQDGSYFVYYEITWDSGAVWRMKELVL